MSLRHVVMVATDVNRKHHRPFGVKTGVDKTRNMEHPGTFRNIPEHEKIKIFFYEKKN